MKSKSRLCLTILSSILILVLAVVAYKFISARAAAKETGAENVAPVVESSAPEGEKDMAELKLQLPEGASIVGVAAHGGLISAAYTSDKVYKVAVFAENGTLLCEPYQGSDAVSAAFTDSGELALRYSDVLEVWDAKANTKVYSCSMGEGDLQDADGKAVWHTETTVKNNEIDVPTTYITKAVRTTADDIQSSFDMPDGTTRLIYAGYPYLYYEKEIQDYKQVICRINVDTGETAELADWIRGKDTQIGHASRLFKSEVLMPWELLDQMFVVNRAHIIGRDGATLLLQEDNRLSVIDAKNKTVLWQTPYDGETVSSAVTEDKSCVVIADASSVTVYHWQDGGEATDAAELVELATLSERVEAQREALLADHGITVTNDETMVGEYFQPKALDSELRSYAMGIELTNFFELLPQGMTDEMRPAELQTFPVCLTGYMTCVGLSVPYDQQYYMALDVNFIYDSFLFNSPEEKEISPFIDTLPHEFMHMLEYRLTQTTLPDGEPILSLWDATVPIEDGEAFTGTYEGEWDVRNSLDGGDPAEDIWFEASYSRTMPEEDRSTLFACLFSGAHINGEGWEVYPHLLEKGQLLCAIIREAYPSVKATLEGSMYWERNFEQKPLSAFQTQQ